MPPKPKSIKPGEASQGSDSKASSVGQVETPTSPRSSNSSDDSDNESGGQEEESGNPPAPKTFPNATEILEKLREVITGGGKGLISMFGEEEELDDKLKKHVELGERMGRKLVDDMGCSHEIAKDLTVLTLYDLAILIDDSDSIVKAEGGERRQTLIHYIDSITRIYTLANPNGILAMRFLNKFQGKMNWKKESSKSYLDNHPWGGVTRIGTELKEKILDPFVYKARDEQSKPLLVLIVTDGAIEGERKGHLRNVIYNCVNERDKSGKGFGAVTFQFTRIGNDPGASKFLKELDKDKKLGEYIDILPVDIDLKSQLDEDEWFVLPKILLGAILPDWDKQDYYDNSEEQDRLGSKQQNGDGEDGDEYSWAKGGDSSGDES